MAALIALIVVGVLIITEVVVVVVLNRRRPGWRRVMAERVVRAMGRLPGQR